MANVIPYIYFKGNCQEAADVYKDIFGGEAEIQKDGNRVIQLEFTAGDIHFMGSDAHEKADNDNAARNLSTYSMVLNCDSEDQLKQYFEKLVKGGKEIFGVTDSGWGAIVAHCEDKFGIAWLLNFDKP